MAGLIVNNIAYNWSMIQLISNELGEDGSGVVLQGVSAIKWKKSREVKPNYGLSGKQVSRGLGNEVCTASITMDYATQVFLRANLNSLMELGAFDLVIQFADPVSVAAAQGFVPGDDNSSWVTETITLKNCFFSEDGFESQTDDDDIKQEFDLHPLKILISST